MKGYLSLRSGETFEGTLHHLETTKQSDIVVYTGMSGFCEVITNPAYANKMVVFSYPFIGRCGINQASFESNEIQVDGVIIQSLSDNTYHYEAEKSVAQLLQEKQIPYMTKVDTRSLVRTLTKTGATQAIMSNKKESVTMPNNHAFTRYEGRSGTVGKGSIHLAVIDLGMTRSSVQLLEKEDVTLTFISTQNINHQLEQLNVDAVMITNGSQTVPESLKKEIKKIIQTYPIMAFGLGLHVVLEVFDSIYKPLHFGHFGNNYPMIDEKTKQVYVTSQHHRYELDEQTLPEEFEVRFRNCNDQSIEGVIHKSYPFIGLECPIQPAILPVIRTFLSSLQAK